LTAFRTGFNITAKNASRLTAGHLILTVDRHSDDQDW